MMSFSQKIKNGILWLAPHGLVEAHHEKYARLLAAKEKKIKDYFLSLDPKAQSPELLEIIDYIGQYGFSVMPYSFTRKYHASDVEVFNDPECSMNYVLHRGQKLYFPQRWGIHKIRHYYTGLCIEQDKDSPHLYETEVFRVGKNEIIADIGAAEGIWALMNAAQAKKIYLFECAEEWLKALQKTFEPWKEKICIVNKFVADKSDGKNQISLDDHFRDKEIDFIKADIEGAEIALINGGQETFRRRKNIKLLLCTYHHADDAQIIEKKLRKAGFATEFSQRHIIFIYDKNLQPPYIRKGLIRAKKQIENLT